MPLYEYRCGKCKHVFELLRSRAERENATACPGCGGSKCKLMMSTFAGRVGSGDGGGAAVSGGGGCGGCHASSCAGCRRG